jgi:hypothetical protein
VELQKRQVFGVVPEGYPTRPAASRKEATHIALISPETDPQEVHVRVVSEKVNYDLLKSWIPYCKNKHKKVCGLLESNLLPCKRVIDCCENSVILAPRTCRYVVLSYV